MRIKKIEWRERIEDDGSSWFSSNLPFQYHVSIQVTVDHQCHWNVSNWRCDIVGGTVPTVEQAKDACQVAWEKMVMEALDADECCGGGMTKNEFLEALRELEIPVEGGSVHNGKETYVLGNDKCVKVEFEICDEDSVYNFVTLSSTRGSLRLTVNMWLKELEFADWGNMEGFIVNNNSTDDGATVSLGYDV